jgi:hypothetical protein
MMIANPSHISGLAFDLHDAIPSPIGEGCDDAKAEEVGGHQNDVISYAQSHVALRSLLTILQPSMEQVAEVARQPEISDSYVQSASLRKTALRRELRPQESEIQFPYVGFQAIDGNR